MLDKHEKPTLLLDARPLDGGQNGIARVVSMLVRELPALVRARIILLSNRAVVLEAPIESVEVHEDLAWSHIPGNLWLTLRVPYLLRKMNATHFFGTQHLLPMIRTVGVHYGVLMHDIVHIKFPDSMKWSNRLSSQILFSRSYRIADSIVAVSNTTRQDLQDALGYRDITVAYPGLDSSRFTAKNTRRKHNDTPRLLYVGSLDPRKNLTALLDVFEFLNQKSRVIDLVICSGNQWQAGALLSRIDSYSGFGKLALLRNVSDAELAQHLHDADALVFPSKYEGFGLPLLEAAGRTEIIANDIPVFRELSDYISGIEFVDFSASPADIAQQFNNALMRCMNKEGTELTDPMRFSWRQFAKGIARALAIDAKNDQVLDIQG